MALQLNTGHGPLQLHKDEPEQDGFGWVTDQMPASYYHSAPDPPLTDVSDVIITVILRGAGMVVFGADVWKDGIRRAQYFKTRLKAGDVYVLAGAARTDATHGVVPE
jgi:hypothetical protein